MSGDQARRLSLGQRIRRLARASGLGRLAGRCLPPPVLLETRPLTKALQQ